VGHFFNGLESGKGEISLISVLKLPLFGLEYFYFFVVKLCLFYLIEDYGVPSQQTTISLTIVIGDSSIPSLSTFEKVQLKYSHPKYVGLILGLIVLIITFVLFICIIITCILLRKHRRRHQAAILARNKLLCSSSQQLTSSGSTTTTNTTSSSIEQQHIANIVQIKPTYWDEKSYDRHSSNTYTSMFFFLRVSILIQYFFS
jgi:hypothetical protein